MGIWFLVILCIILAASIVVMEHQKKKLLIELFNAKALEKDKEYFFCELKNRAEAYKRDFRGLFEIYESFSDPKHSPKLGQCLIQESSTHQP